MLLRTAALVAAVSGCALRAPASDTARSDVTYPSLSDTAMSRDSLDPARGSAVAEAFWMRLHALCGKAFAGRLAEGNAADSAFRTAELRMHVRECSPTEIRIPFHLGGDRSRTWVVTRLPNGRLRLKHDHRHADGSEDAVTQYGGDTPDAGTTMRQEFHADAQTAALIPTASTNVWTVEVTPATFSYGLRRVNSDRRFRVEFDLTTPVPAPPAPWGAQ